MAGFSIPAAEHRYIYMYLCILPSLTISLLSSLSTQIPHLFSSTITSWTKDGEADAFRNMLAKVSA